MNQHLSLRYGSLQTYGAKVDQIKAEIGDTVSQSEIVKALKSKKYKVLTFTHVDTSTGECQVVDISRCTHDDIYIISCIVRRESNCRDCQKGFSRNFGIKFIYVVNDTPCSYKIGYPGRSMRGSI